MKLQYFPPIYFYVAIAITFKLFIASILVVMYNNNSKGALVKIVGIARIGLYYMIPVFGDVIAYAISEVNFGNGFGFLYLYFLAVSLICFFMVFMVIRLQIYPFRSLS